MPKISELPAETTPANDDPLAIVDNAGAITKKITREDLFKGTPLPADTVDEQAIEDEAVTTPKIDDEAVTPAKLKLGKTHFKGYRGGNQTTTSTSWQTVTNVTGATTGTLNITTNGGALLVSITMVTSVSANNAEIGFRINGVDYEVLTYGANTAMTRTGSRIVTGLPAGSYTFEFRFKSSGGGTSTAIAFFDYCLTAVELSV